jgi:hypothetical protein
VSDAPEPPDLSQLPPPTEPPAGSGTTPAATPAPASAAPAGWYPDPTAGGRQRWWDGTRWYPPQQVVVTGAQTDGFAITALVLAIIGAILLAPVFAILSLSRIKAGKRTAGRGLAIAALWISGAWLVLVAGIVLLVVLSQPDPNVDHYHGAKRPIAKVVDDFEDAADDHDGDRLCSLLTTDLRGRIERGGKSCPDFMTEDKGVQAHLDVKSISIVTPNGASAIVREDGNDLHFTFVKLGGTWKIAEITDAP